MWSVVQHDSNGHHWKVIRLTSFHTYSWSLMKRAPLLPYQSLYAVSLVILCKQHIEVDKKGRNVPSVKELQQKNLLSVKMYPSGHEKTRKPLHDGIYL